MKEGFKFPETHLFEEAAQKVSTAIRSPLVRAFALSLLAACNGDCSGEKPFPDLAEELKPFAQGMDPANKQHFGEVIALMESDLNGVRVERSTFKENPKIRAMASVPRNFSDPTLPKITLNENWRSDNGIDLALAVHELGHVTDLLDSKRNLDEETWVKVYGAPGKATEVRTELRAWDLQLVLLNQMSGGLLDEFYKEAKSANSQESADLVLATYVDKIAKKLSAREDQKGMLKRWLEIYFNYKAPERFGIDCRWTYDFVVQIATEYDKQGIPMYEVDLKPEDQKSDPSRCIDPLPEGSYDYATFRSYEEIRPGMVGPSSEARHFGR